MLNKEIPQYFVPLYRYNIVQYYTVSIFSSHLYCLANLKEQYVSICIKEQYETKCLKSVLH